MKLVYAKYYLKQHFLCLIDIKHKAKKGGDEQSEEQRVLEEEKRRLLLIEQVSTHMSDIFTTKKLLWYSTQNLYILNKAIKH